MAENKGVCGTSMFDAGGMISEQSLSDDLFFFFFSLQGVEQIYRSGGFHQIVEASWSIMQSVYPHKQAK